MKPSPLMSRLLFRPTLYWTLIKTRGLKLEEHWTEIDGTLILGALPMRRELAVFPELHVGGVINMCAEWNGHLSHYHDAGIKQLHLPTPDFTSPDIQAVREGVEFIDQFAKQGQRVYCHCKAGRGRSATIALAWLIHSRGLTPKFAEQQLIARRPQVNRCLSSREVVREFAESRVTSDVAI
jgi:atypical dual specificity phosphatase